MTPAVKRSQASWDDREHAAAERALAKSGKSDGKPGKKFANQAENVLKIKGRK
jgi:hypothetical protein